MRQEGSSWRKFMEEVHGGSSGREFMEDDLRSRPAREEQGGILLSANSSSGQTDGTDTTHFPSLHVIQEVALVHKDVGARSPCSCFSELLRCSVLRYASSSPPSPLLPVSCFLALITIVRMSCEKKERYFVLLLVLLFPRASTQLALQTFAS
eukprot:751227-Hanusia_phi.AAC.2